MFPFRTSVKAAILELPPFLFSYTTLYLFRHHKNQPYLRFLFFSIVQFYSLPSDISILFFFFLSPRFSSSFFRGLKEASVRQFYVAIKPTAPAIYQPSFTASRVTSAAGLERSLVKQPRHGGPTKGTNQPTSQAVRESAKFAYITKL